MAASQSALSAATATPMFAPDGTVRMVPNSQIPDAMKAGLSHAVPMRAPDKTLRYVRPEQVSTAMKAGGKVDWSESEESHKEGFWGAMGDLLGMAKGLGNTALAAGEALAGDNTRMAEMAANAAQQDINRAEKGESIPYRAAAAGATLAGTNVPGMEQAAAEGDTAGVIGHAVAPIAAMGIAKGVGAAARPAAEAASTGARRTLLLGKTPQEAYKSALKPSTTIPEPKQAAMVETGLREGIPISKSGLDKLGDLVDDLNQRIKDVIQKDPNRPIDPNKVATRTAQTTEAFKKQVNAAEDVSAIQKSTKQFLREQGAKPASPPQPTGLLDESGRPIMTEGTPAKPAPPMGAAAAQEMKQGTYRQLKGKAYGELKSAQIESQKALARGLKEEIANQFPELKELNARESQLLNLEPVLERAVNRIGNHQLVGIGTPVTAGAAKAVFGSNKIAAAAGVMKAVLDNPAVKSRLAIALSRTGKVTPQQAFSRISSYREQLGSAYAALPAVANVGTQGQSSTE